MYTYVATAILSAAIAATGAWKVQAWRYDSKELAAQQNAQAQARLRRQGAEAQSVAYEVVREKLRTEYIPILQEVEREADASRDRECLSADGVRLVNDAIRTANNPGEPSNPMPAASGTAGR